MSSVATEDMSSVATEDMSYVATEDMSSVATEDMYVVATEDMSSAATEDMFSVATEDVPAVAAEDMSSVATDDMYYVAVKTCSLLQKKTCTMLSPRNCLLSYICQLKSREVIKYTHKSIHVAALHFASVWQAAVRAMMALVCLCNVLGLFLRQCDAYRMYPIHIYIYISFYIHLVKFHHSIQDHVCCEHARMNVRRI